MRKLACLMIIVCITACGKFEPPGGESQISSYSGSWTGLPESFSEVPRSSLNRRVGGCYIYKKIPDTDLVVGICKWIYEDRIKGYCLSCRIQLDPALADGNSNVKLTELIIPKEYYDCNDYIPASPDTIPFEDIIKRITVKHKSIILDIGRGKLEYTLL